MPQTGANLPTLAQEIAIRDVLQATSVSLAGKENWKNA
jgi:hypothetical protein